MDKWIGCPYKQKEKHTDSWKIRTDEKEDNKKDMQKEIDGWAYRQKGKHAGRLTARQ